MPTEHIETLIIGGGQSGLTMSHMLSKRGRPHLVLERHRIAERWRSDRWDGLRFQGPNWSVRFPDFPFPHTDPDGYASSRDIADFVAGYAEFIKAPVRCGVEVKKLRRTDRGFAAETAGGQITADNVVAATGPYQYPAPPPFVFRNDNLLQLHTTEYRNSSRLPDGGVLIVGAGNSGGQIAEELMREGRQVFLSIGRHRRVPRAYRGRNLHWWFEALGIDKAPPEQRGPDRSPMIMTGAYGGHTVDFRRFAAQGMVVLGRTLGETDGVFHFADDLTENLTKGDDAYLAFLAAADAAVIRDNLGLPEEKEAWIIPPALTGQPIRELDQRKTGIRTVIWANGFRPDFSWIEGLECDPTGAPRHHRGVTAIPGLYMLGLPFLTSFVSSFLAGVGDDAAMLADHMVARQRYTGGLMSGLVART